MVKDGIIGITNILIIIYKHVRFSLGKTEVKLCGK